MLRSMFAGVSGLRAHQTMMDVTGNNISNVNTAGYKSTRVTFQETLTQVSRGATAPREARGGTNAFQVGLGSRAAAIDQNFGQGASQLTGRTTDLAIQGEGFFAVEADGQRFYTRAGAFSWDAPDAGGESRLVAPNGEVVLGADEQPITLNLANYADVTIGSDGSITGRDVNSNALADLGQVGVATFANNNGLTRVGNSLYTESQNSGAAALGAPGDAGSGQLQAGVLEMSNVDLAQEFTGLIMAQRGFQANARTITSSDEMLSELVNIKR